MRDVARHARSRSRTSTSRRVSSAAPAGAACGSAGPSRGTSPVGSAPASLRAPPARPGCRAAARPRRGRSPAATLAPRRAPPPSGRGRRWPRGRAEARGCRGRGGARRRSYRLGYPRGTLRGCSPLDGWRGACVSVRTLSHRCSQTAAMPQAGARPTHLSERQYTSPVAPPPSGPCRPHAVAVVSCRVAGLATW